MMAGSSKPSRRLFEPSRNDQCLCGSGKKFKQCCLPRIPFNDQGQKLYAALEKGDYATALQECRAYITQYTIWHKSHTFQLISRDPERGAKLLYVDIRAISSFVDHLIKCAMNLDMVSDVPATLERLRANIADVRWQRRIIYFQAIVAMWPNWNEDEGRRELKRLGSVSEDQDAELLELYLDLFGDEMTFSGRQEMASRIVQFTDSEGVRLQYRGFRAVEYLKIGDRTKAESDLDEAISLFKKERKEQSDLGYSIYRFAMSLELLGNLRSDANLLDEAIKEYRYLLDSGTLNDRGNANIWRCIGDAYRCKAAWKEASDAYRNSLNTAPHSIAGVFLSECLLNLDGWERAFEAISAVDLKMLDQHEYADYVFVFAAISTESADTKMLHDAEKLLRSLHLNDQIFLQRRDTLLLGVIDTQRLGKSSSIITKAKKALRGVAWAASRYLKLEPNIYGIGINLGKVLEDIGKGEREHSSGSEQGKVKKSGQGT